MNHISQFIQNKPNNILMLKALVHSLSISQYYSISFIINNVKF